MHKSEEDRSNFAQSVSILEVELAGINWEKIEFPISIDAEKIENYISEECINMEQSALTVGEYIIELWHEQGKLPAYSLHQIVHSTQDDIWRFDYLAGRKNPLDDYGGVYVAINGSTGKIIKAWIEEW